MNVNTVLAPFFLFSFLVSSVFAQGGALTINSLLNVVQCQPSLITWSGGSPPYFLSILPADQPTAVALVNLGVQQGTSFTWKANLTAGTSAFLQLRDSTGAIGQSASFHVLSSSDSSCISGAPVASAPTGTATGTATGASSVPAGTTPTASGTVPARSSVAVTTGGTTKSSQSASSTSSGASGPTSSSGAVPSHYAPVGGLAMIGAAALALVL